MNNVMYIIQYMYTRHELHILIYILLKGRFHNYKTKY